MNRLRSYRWIEGINQTELGGILGVSTQLISAIESGQRSPTCDISVLGYAPHRIEAPEMTEPLHRQRANTAVAATRRARELIRLAGETFIALRHDIPAEFRDRMQRPEGGACDGEDAADDDAVPRGRALERLGTPQGYAEAAEFALEVREGILRERGDGPLRNLTRAVERAGVCLVPLTGLQGIDGLSTWVEDQPVIGLRVDAPGDRFRFSLAHEIGHLVMHTRKSPVSEDEANRFASALLMTDDDFDAAIPEHPTLSDFIAMKRDWGVSVGALVYRAHQLGYLDSRSYRSLQIQMSKWGKHEPAAIDPVYGRLLPALIERHGGAGGCAQQIGLNERHLRAVTSWRHLRAL